RGEEWDLWFEHDVVRRVRRDAARTLDPTTVEEEHRAIASDVRTFADLVEGQRVLYRHERGASEATLVEKCRFGALVARADGVILGVGFRRVAPAPRPSPS